MEHVGSVLADKSDMGDIRSTSWVGRKHEDSGGHIVHFNKFHLLYYYCVTLLKKDMATITAAWKVAITLCSLILGSSFLIALRVKILVKG